MNSTIKYYILAICLIGSMLFSLTSVAQGALVLKDTNDSPVLFNVTIDVSNNQEYVKICRQIDGKDSCSKSAMPLIGNYDITAFKTLCFTLIKANLAADIKSGFESDEMVIDRITSIYEVWRTNSIQNTIRYLQSDQPAGVLSLNSEYIRLVPKGDDCSCGGFQQQTQKNSASFLPTAPPEEPTLKIERVAFTISDNYINKVTIVGQVIIADGNEKVVITNKSWSLSIRSFAGQSITIFKDGDKKYNLCYCDLFRYEPHPVSGAFNFYVQDEEFSLLPGESKVLTKRNLDDYIGINITSDFLGLNSNNANNLLITEFNVVLPLAMSQYKRMRYTPYAAVRLSFAAVDGINGKNDILPVNYTQNRDTLFVDYFDLLRFQNIKTDLHLGFVGLELKNINSIFHLGGGSEFYRTGLQSKVINSDPGGEDEITNFSAFSMVPYLRLTGQYRPDINFGVDLKVDVKNFMTMRFANDAPQILPSNGIYDDYDKLQFNSISNWRQRMVYSVELDLFAHIGGKAGLFSRVGFDVTSPQPGRNIFPRILVGYSTNLDAYINKVQKKS